VSGTADAAYNQYPDSRISVSGNTTEVNGVPVITRSFMQDTGKLSVTEAELDSLVSNVQEMLFSRQILESVGLRVALPMEASSDNMGVINLINNWSVNNQTRHVANKAMWLRELKEWGILVVAYKPGSEMYSDPLTKNLPKQPYEKHNSHYVVTNLNTSNTAEQQLEQLHQQFAKQGEQQQARESAGIEEIEDVNGVRDCDKSGRLPQLANCVRANAHKSNG
jgi:hypothetical protein